jgi:spore coat polysaccharide biosynthesis protein SpsF
MKVVAVVQARSGSTRLPGKVLLPLGEKTMLERMLERLVAARSPEAVIVATTVDPADDAVARAAHAAGVECFRGHPTDLLDRHYQVGLRASADVLVKIPSDCPLIDPAVVDRVVGAHVERSGLVDYTSNLHPESYPDGSDVEAMTFDALAVAWREAIRPYEREHTTPFLWDQPGRFRLENVLWEAPAPDIARDVSLTHRVVVDYEDDYEVVRAVFEALWSPGRPVFSVGEIVAFLDAHPKVRARNASRRGVSWYRLHAGEFRTDPRAPRASELPR